MRRLLAILLTVLIGSGTLWAAGPTMPTLQIAVFDENGTPVEGAHVYIFSRDKKKFIGTRDVNGAESLDLPAGSYRIYAAMTSQTNGILEHYASPEACLRLFIGQPQSVILTLHRAQQTETYLSDSAMKKLGIDQTLAHYIN